jgi:hypothetical protein
MYPGKLNFATDAWTSPNHRAFIAITVHFAPVGNNPCNFILDVVELPTSHTGKNLAQAFARVMTEFGIQHKVSPVFHSI